MRLLVRIRIASPDACWLWTGSLNRWGTARFRFGRQELPAARALWLLTQGEIPSGHRVTHSCGNPGCLNPGHLELTGPAPVRVRQPQRFTSADIREIRRLRAQGLPGREVAARFRTSPSTVSAIALRRRYSWIEDTSAAPSAAAGGA